MSHSFPKIIWQTHNYKKEWLPHHLNQIAATWVNLNPGWEYRYADQVQRDEKVRQYPEIYEIYKYRMPVVQSDIWRFIVTYEEGGCYADMDSVCHKPLDYMIETIGGNPEMITVPINKNMGNTHNFVVQAKSPTMKLIVDKMIKGDGQAKPNPTHPFSTFVNLIYLPNRHSVSQKFDAAYHSMEYKQGFAYKKHMINYYGEEMSYVDFLEKNGLSLTL